MTVMAHFPGCRPGRKLCALATFPLPKLASISPWTEQHAPQEKPPEGGFFLLNIHAPLLDAYGVSLLICVDQLPSAPRVPLH